MCRFVGIVDSRKNAGMGLEQKIIAMRDSLAHGGPDDAGIHVDNQLGVALGHRRLSIIDLSDLGHQPMTNVDASIWLTFNGEIYNFSEIRKQLQLLGHTFRSTSDTEVILKAYEQWGEEAFSELSGMFSFCILDKRFSTLYLVRDHAGIKPLYYQASQDSLIFGSEVRAFKALDKSWDEEPSWKTCFFVFGHIPEPFTTLRNVFSLPKGSYLKLDLRSRNHQIKKYSQLAFTDLIKDDREALDQVRSQLTGAIHRHLVSDAPLGVFLSGGIDSSLLALVAHHFLKDNLKTLSIIFSEKAYSEEKFQEIVMGKTRAKHTSYLVREDDFKKAMPDILQAMDQPTVDGVNTYFISRCAKEAGLKSVLSGLGGDELFGGYSSFRQIAIFWHLRKLNGNLKKAFGLFEHSSSDKLRKLSFLSLQISPSLCYYFLFRGLFSLKETSKILGLARKEVCEAIEKIQLDVDAQLGRRNFISFLETNLYMQNQLLKDTDFMSMWHSVEIRVPYLDKEFMKLLFSISEKVKFSGSSPKSLLKKAFEDLLPKEIAKRKKQGFTFPMGQWIKGQGRGFFEEAVTKGGLERKCLIDLWNRFEHNNLHWSRIWAPIVFSAKQDMFS